MQNLRFNPGTSLMEIETVLRWANTEIFNRTLMIKRIAPSGWKGKPEELARSKLLVEARQLPGDHAYGVCYTEFEFEWQNAAPYMNPREVYVYHDSSDLNYYMTMMLMTVIAECIEGCDYDRVPTRNVGESYVHLGELETYPKNFRDLLPMVIKSVRDGRVA